MARTASADGHPRLLLRIGSAHRPLADAEGMARSLAAARPRGGFARHAARGRPRVARKSVSTRLVLTSRLWFTRTEAR